MSEQNYRAFWDEALHQIHEEYKQNGQEDHPRNQEKYGSRRLELYGMIKSSGTLLPVHSLQYSTADKTQKVPAGNSISGRNGIHSPLITG